MDSVHIVYRKYVVFFLGEGKKGGGENSQIQRNLCSSEMQFQGRVVDGASMPVCSLAVRDRKSPRKTQMHEWASRTLTGATGRTPHTTLSVLCRNDAPGTPQR